jgi:hypothetical protein
MGLSKKQVQLLISPGYLGIHGKRVRSIGANEPTQDVCATLLDDMAQTQRAKHRTLIGRCVNLGARSIERGFHCPQDSFHRTQVGYRMRIRTPGLFCKGDKASGAADPTSRRATRAVPEAWTGEVKVFGTHHTLNWRDKATKSDCARIRRPEGCSRPLTEIDLCALRLAAEVYVEKERLRMVHCNECAVSDAEATTERLAAIQDKHITMLCEGQTFVRNLRRPNRVDRIRFRLAASFGQYCKRVPMSLCELGEGKVLKTHGKKSPKTRRRRSFPRTCDFFANDLMQPLDEMLGSQIVTSIL